MLKNHLTYNWWKYLIVLIVGIFGVDLLYTLTEPRVPDDRKIEVIVCGASLDQDFSEYMERVRINQMPDLMKTELSVIPNDETAIQYLTVRIGTQGGDLYFLPEDQFGTMAENGALLPLEDDADLKRIIGNLNLDTGWRTEYGSRDMHLYGIPIYNQNGKSQFSGLEQYFYIPNGYLCLLRYGKNLDNARKFLQIVCQDMMSDPSLLGGPRVSTVRFTVLGSTVQSGFQDRIQQLVTRSIPENIRLEVSVHSDLARLMNGIYDRQADIYLMPDEYFQPLALEGAFLPLENEDIMMLLDPVELIGHWTVNNQTGASNLYGIPAGQLPGLADYFSVDNGVLCTRASSEEMDRVLAVLRIVCREALSDSQD